MSIIRAFSSGDICTIAIHFVKNYHNYNRNYRYNYYIYPKTGVIECNMRFALIDNKPTEAASGLNGGVCPGCGAPVIAKCGTHKVHHWAHKGVKMCDNWWEPETEWHRAWKNNFPKEWQEIFCRMNRQAKNISQT